MREDRFLTFEQMEAVSRDLENAGFKHVRCLHLVDPEWRKAYRSTRPELENTAWTITLAEGMTPMARIKTLVEVCERHGMTFWMNTAGEDSEIYFRVGDPSARIGHIPS